MTSTPKLAKRIIRDARRRGLTIAIAESLTGGKVASALIGVPRASTVVRLGVIAYATEMKRRVLNVDGELLDKRGAVHPKVAKQMASGVRKLAAIGRDSATIGVGTTGVAGPDVQDGHDVGTVFISVAFKGEATITRDYRFEGNRRSIRDAATHAALELIAEALSEYKD